MIANPFPHLHCAFKFHPQIPPRWLVLFSWLFLKNKFRTKLGGLCAFCFNDFCKFPFSADRKMALWFAPCPRSVPAPGESSGTVGIFFVTVHVTSSIPVSGAPETCMSGVHVKDSTLSFISEKKNEPNC